MELNVTITKKQFNNYITKLRNSKKSSCYELKKWEDFNEQYFELIKKYIKDNVTDSDEKIRIYFMPFYDSNIMHLELSMKVNAKNVLNLNSYMIKNKNFLKKWLDLKIKNIHYEFLRMILLIFI
ncbi:hypothetical protein [Mycoplasmopsis caviae]|uniref:hypothetical protein n=1 Tax=Mycoplasmopsis caviae TaxID=55603 RepID=UPI000F7E2CB6|nr:hypothetical protein [Mycoplasmopsis caviae]